MEKLSTGRRLGRFFAASRQRLREAARGLGVHHLPNANQSTSGGDVDEFTPDATFVKTLIDDTRVMGCLSVVSTAKSEILCGERDEGPSGHH